jgi:hypothetical protein
MPRFFFHIRDDAELIPDEEGTNLPDLAAARREAVLSVRAIIVEAISSSEPWDHVAIEVTDEQGNVLETVQVATHITDADQTRH